jgi:dihydrofolate synthase / folylpolyglutamate synthase
MSDILARLNSLETLGIKFGLENIRRLLQELGNPQREYPSVLIAGTNGKGSVGAMLEAILFQNGFHTGYYLSPHLVDVRERIRFDRKKISERFFDASLAKVFGVVDRLSMSPTYFETLTAAGLLYFAEEKVDWGVIEVGLGGRLDATNSVTQALSIITSIGLDHESFLGNDLASIAREKAMISKQGIPMIIGNLSEKAREVVERVCAATLSSVLPISSSHILEPRLENGFPLFHYEPWHREIRLNLRGMHQIQNASIALLAIDQLQRNGCRIDRDLAVQALGDVRWPGRLEIVPGFTPPLLLDCAHNPMGTAALVEFMNDMQWFRSIVLFTAMKDKNYTEMLRLVAPHTERIFLCTVEPLHRCATMDELMTAASIAGIESTFDPDPSIALRDAISFSRSSGLPLVTFGSIYFIGHVFRLLGITT